MSGAPVWKTYKVGVTIHALLHSAKVVIFVNDIKNKPMWLTQNS